MVLHGFILDHHNQDRSFKGAPFSIILFVFIFFILEMDVSLDMDLSLKAQDINIYTQQFQTTPPTIGDKNYHNEKAGKEKDGQAATS